MKILHSSTPAVKSMEQLKLFFLKLNQLVLKSEPRVFDLAKHDRKGYPAVVSPQNTVPSFAPFLRFPAGVVKPDSNVGCVSYEFGVLNFR